MLKGKDRERVLAIVDGLYRNQLLLAQHKTGEPVPDFHTPAGIKKWWQA